MIEVGRSVPVDGGWDLPGHVGDDDVELFLAGQPQPGPQAWMVDHRWRSTGPDGLLQWSTLSTQPGSVPVTRMRPADAPQHWCASHPFEPADEAFDEVNVPDGPMLASRALHQQDRDPDARRCADRAGDGHVTLHLCGVCAAQVHHLTDLSATVVRVDVSETSGGQQQLRHRFADLGVAGRTLVLDCSRNTSLSHAFALAVARCGAAQVVVVNAGWEARDRLGGALFRAGVKHRFEEVGDR